MQKETTINTLFGKNIYKATIANYETINKNVISDIKSFVKEKPGAMAATTDVVGNTKIFFSECFSTNLRAWTVFGFLICLSS